MNKEEIYILSAKQISMQQPLDEEWMEHPLYPSEPFVRALNPDFKPYIPPMEARRMGSILKRAIAVSVEALRNSGLVVSPDNAVPSVDAVITGTGYGCIENTELFLDPLCREGENLLKPTCFMQSTHNTIGAQIAIRTGNHGYNMTYAHKHISFESALYDAWLQLRLKKIGTALVGGHDEMTPVFFEILRKGGIFGQGAEVCGEAATAVVLGGGKAVDSKQRLCRLAGMRILSHFDTETLNVALQGLLVGAGHNVDDIDAVLCGVSGNPSSDTLYQSEISRMVGEKPLLRYKHIFGQSFTASGLGFYVAVQCLKRGFIPDFLYVNEKMRLSGAPKCLLLYNRGDGHSCSLILLEA
ncbi:MAG: beta-ketoacyl synthase chain length factor [Bacteroidales bacterium]|nr:beta-ketoacyl synthase chain length factor [Bacteroidales bacterium]